MSFGEFCRPVGQWAAALSGFVWVLKYTKTVLRGGQSNPGIQKAAVTASSSLDTVFCSDGTELTKTFLLFAHSTKWFKGVLYWV